MIVYTLCGAFGVLGWPLFAANMVLYTLMMAPADTRALWLLLFGDYYGRYLSFNDWIMFSIRRHTVERAIEFVSLFVMAIPGVGLVLMPLMGLLQVWNLVDFQNWQQVWWTLGLPFMYYQQYDYDLLMQYQY